MSPTFRPLRVVNLNLEVGRTLADVDGLGGYGSLFGIVCMHGVPLGYIEAPLTSDRCSGQQLTDIILNQHEETVLSHLLATALIDGSFARAGGLVELPRARSRCSRKPLPSLTVAVCTRDRGDDLSRCLASLELVNYPSLDVLVVDNAPRDDSTERIVRLAHPGMRYVREPRPGLNWARGRAVRETDRELLAYVDDDVVVDPEWALAVATVMAENLDVMAVTGLVAPLELESESQLLFERLGGLGKGFVRRWLRRVRGEPAARFANAGGFGVGANMAFRRAVFGEVGLFDPALGAGTITGGGDDLDLFFRILRAGHTLVYEPGAMVRHRHRRDEAALSSQLRNWCMGMQAFLVRSMRAYPDERLALSGLAARLLLLHYPRRVVQSLADPRLRPGLAFAQLRGAVAGLRRYGPSERHAIEVAVRFGENAPHVTTAPLPRPFLRSLRTVRLALDEPLPSVLPGPDDSDQVRIEVVRAGRRVGAVTIACGGQPIGRTRVGDAIVAGLGPTLLGPAHELKRELRAAFRTG